MGVPGAVAREIRGHAAGGGRRHVHRAGSQRRGRARCGDGPDFLDLFLYARRPRRAPAAAASIAAWRYSATRCSWAPSTRIWSPSTPRTASLLWDTTVAKAEAGYAMTHAPLVVKDKVIVGTAGGEFGIRGFIAAYDVHTGKEVWRFYTIPGPGEPGNETWAGDSWKTGGASVWVTGSYDPASEPDLLGHRQSGPGLERRPAARRQPLQRFRGRAGRRHRQAEMVLPVLAARRIRLRFRAGPGAGRYRMAKGPEEAAQGDAVGQSQRLLLCPRPHHRRVPAGQAVRRSELGERVRRKGPADAGSGQGADARKGP